MKILLGPAGIPMSAKGLTTSESIKKLANMGLTAMEISFTHGVYMSAQNAKIAEKAAADSDISLSIHAPYFVNLASENEKIIKDSKKRILDSLRIGNILGATVVVVHAGFYGKDIESSNRKIMEACQEISDIIDVESITTKLAVESMGKQKSWGTLDEVIEASKKIKNVVPCIDFSHIYARNGGKIDFKVIFDALEGLKIDRYHSHLSGILYTLKEPQAGNEKSHVPLKESGPDFEALAKEILSRNRSITIISESPILEMDSLMLRETFEKNGFRF